MGNIVTPATVDISDVVAESQRHAERMKATTDALNTVEEGHAASVEREVSAIQREGQLARDAKLMLDSLTIQKEKRNAEAAAAFGVNPEAANSVINSMAQSILDQHGQLKAAGQEILRKKEVGISDDPVEWLFNAFTIPRDISAYNTREAILNRDVQTLKALEDLTQEQVTTNNAIAATTNTQISAMQAEGLLRAAQVRAENARQEAARFGVQTASVRLAVSHQQFESVVQLNNAQVQLQKLEIEKAQKNINEEMKELQKKNLQLLIDKRDKDAKDHALLQSNLDIASSVAGMRRITVDEYERAPQQTKAALFDLMSNPNVMQGRLGSDPADALANADRLNAPLTPQIAKVRDALLDIANKTAAKDPTWQTKKPDQQKRLVNEAIINEAKEQYNNIPDTGSFYSPPPLASLRGIPAISSTILWKSTFAPQANNPMRVTSAQAFYDTAVDLVAGGKMKQEDAAKELAQIFKAIAVDNSQQRDFNRLAIPMQNKYQTVIKSVGSPHDVPWGYTGAGKVLDMTNETQINNFITRAMVARKNIEAGSINPLPETR